MLRLTQIDHVALAVSDPAKSAQWYQAVLGLERRHQEVWGDYPVMMCVGDTCVALFPAKPSQPGDSTGLSMRHLAFRADRHNFSLAQATLRRLQIPFDYQDHQMAHSIYFRDPDAYQLEITTYDLISAPL